MLAKAKAQTKTTISPAKRFLWGSVVAAIVVFEIVLFVGFAWLLYASWQDPAAITHFVMAALDTLTRWSADLAQWAQSYGK